MYSQECITYLRIKCEFTGNEMIGSKTNEWLNKIFPTTMLLQRNDGLKKKVLEIEVPVRSFDLLFPRIANANFENKIFVRRVDM